MVENERCGAIRRSFTFCNGTQSSICVKLNRFCGTESSFWRYVVGDSRRSANFQIWHDQATIQVRPNANGLHDNTLSCSLACKTMIGALEGCRPRVGGVLVSWIIVLLLLLLLLPEHTLCLSYLTCRETIQTVANNSHLCAEDGSGQYLRDDCSLCYTVDETPLFDEAIPVNCGGPCSDDDVVVKVNWLLPQSACSDTASATCAKDTIYQRCGSSAACPDGYCCSKPTPQVYGSPAPWVGCGFPSSCGCNSLPNGEAIEFCTMDCSDMLGGLCMIEGEGDALPGYSCGFDACTEGKAWAYEACGLDGQDSFHSPPYKACSSACETAVRAISDDCPSDHLVSLLTKAWRDDNCGSCQAYYYQRCTSNDDCMPGFCCSLPIKDEVVESVACGPPSQCFCTGGSESKACTRDCSDPKTFGKCTLLGEGSGAYGFSCPVCPAAALGPQGDPPTVVGNEPSPVGEVNASPSGGADAPSPVAATADVPSTTLSTQALQSSELQTSSGDRPRLHVAIAFTVVYSLLSP